MAKEIKENEKLDEAEGLGTHETSAKFKEQVMKIKMLLNKDGTLDVSENPRDANDYPEAVDAMVGNFTMDGQQEPIAVSHRADGSYHVLKGNIRTLAAIKLGWDSIQARVATGLTPEEEATVRNDHGSVTQLSALGVYYAMRQLFRSGYSDLEVVLKMRGSLPTLKGAAGSKLADKQKGKSPDARLVLERDARRGFIQDRQYAAMGHSSVDELFVKKLKGHKAADFLSSSVLRKAYGTYVESIGGKANISAMRDLPNKAVAAYLRDAKKAYDARPAREKTEPEDDTTLTAEQLVQARSAIESPVINIVLAFAAGKLSDDDWDKAQKQIGKIDVPEKVRVSLLEMLKPSQPVAEETEEAEKKAA